METPPPSHRRAAAEMIALNELGGIPAARRLGLHLACAAHDIRRRQTGRPAGHSLPDIVLRDRAIAGLRETGAIEYTGEFGAEITTFIPFVFWLKREGLLEGRRVVTYGGMAPYYHALDPAELALKAGRRSWAPPEARLWPSPSTYAARPAPWRVYPNYRARYQDQGMTFDRPVLFIQNKFTVEWGKGPINYLPLETLERLLTAHAGRCDIVYSRPRPIPDATGYVADANGYCDYPDADILARHPGVLDLEAWCAASGADYNLAKLEILAKSRLFVAVQGGGAHLLACFGGALMLLLDHQSEEYPHAYALGPYKYLADPAPVLLLARSHRALGRGLGVLEAARVESGGVRLAAHTLRDLQAMRI